MGYSAGVRLLGLLTCMVPSFSAAAQITVHDINPGPESSRPEKFTVFGDHVYFTATDGASGQELWRTDGASVEQVAEFVFGPAGSDPDGLTVHDGHLYLETGSRYGIQALWRTNGDGVDLIRFLPFESVESRPLRLIGHGEYLYFASGDTGMVGYGLWKTKGRQATVRLEEVQPVRGIWPDEWIGQWTAMGDALYFTAYDEDHGSELWKTDGVSTAIMADIHPGSSGSYPGGLVASDDYLYFVAEDGTSGRQLWRTDGASLVRLTDFPESSTSSVLEYPMAPFNGGVFFRGNDGVAGQELWFADASGVQLVGDLAPGPAHSYPTTVGTLDGYYYFTTRADDTHRPLWRSDGRSVELVAQIDRGSGPGSDAVALDGYLYLRAEGGLWRTDGSVGETVVSFADASLPYPTSIAAFGGRIYMDGWDAERGEEMWVFDPEQQGAIVTREPDPDLPRTYSIGEAYPNPFNQSTELRVRLSRLEHVRAAVYSVTGSRVATLHDGPLAPDVEHRLDWNATGLPSGLYILSVDAESFRETRKVLFVR